MVDFQQFKLDNGRALARGAPLSANRSRKKSPLHVLASSLPKTAASGQLQRRSPNASPSHCRLHWRWLWTYLRLVEHLAAAGPHREGESQDPSEIGM